MDELIEVFVKVAFFLLVVAAIVFALLWVLGIAVWFALTALISIPAAAGAYGLMWGAEHLYCREQIKRLHHQGKLGDMIQIAFDDSGIRWSIDDEKLRNMSGPVLLLILFSVGIAGIWLLLFLLGHLGVFSIHPGLVSDANVANQISEVMAYLACAAAFGFAMVVMPRHVQHAINFQAHAHVQGRGHKLDTANTLFRSALDLWEQTAELVAQTHSATLAKELDKWHAALRSPDLADFVNNEEWNKYKAYIQVVLRNLAELKQTAEDFDGYDREESVPLPGKIPPPHSDVMTELKAYKELDLSSDASPDEVKDKVKELRRNYNVDQRQNLAKPVRDLLQKKIAVVNDAYDCLKAKGKAV